MGNKIDWRKEEVKKGDNSGQQIVGVWTKTELEVRARYGVSFSPGPNPLGARLAPEPEELDFPQSSDRVGLTSLTIAVAVAFITPTIAPGINIVSRIPFTLRSFLCCCYCCCSSVPPVVDDVGYRRIKVEVFGGSSVLRGYHKRIASVLLHVRTLGIEMRPATIANPDSLRDRTHRQEPLQHPPDALFLVVIFELFLFDKPGYVFYLFPRSSVYVRKDHRITRSDAVLCRGLARRRMVWQGILTHVIFRDGQGEGGEPGRDERF
jgi:hypothetical protein